MTRFILVSFLPATVSYTLKRVRDHFEPGVNEKIPPHISLTYPFWWKKELDELIKIMAKEIRNFSPFLATISGIGVFVNLSQVIYAQVLPKESFEKIHDSLHKTLQGKAEFDISFFPGGKLPSFIPHITLAMNAEEKDVDKAKKMLSSVIGYSFMVKKVWLLKKESGSEEWKKIKKFCLKSKKE